MTKKALTVPAIRVQQGKNRVLYSFAVDGKDISSFATISRISRNDDYEIEGYQRPEVLAHIAEIRKYIDSDSPMIPNAVVIAFDSRVKFTPSKVGSDLVDYVQYGVLSIPINEMDKPGFVVDGQQRIAAIREAEIEEFPICVTGFITDDIKEQTEQFILVNSTKPLPKGLIYELLPNTDAVLSTNLHRKRFPAVLLNRLNHDEKSPFLKKIKTPTNPEGTIKDNSVLRMVENSLSDGVLYKFRYTQDGPDIDSMIEVLSNFWGAVSEVFDEAWELPPRNSRLVHGAGIIGLGFVMDAIAERHRRVGIPSKNQFREDLLPLQEVCSWTRGYWVFGPSQQVKWNEVQNTTRDISTLTNYLLWQYKNLVWSRKVKRRSASHPAQGEMFQ